MSIALMLSYPANCITLVHKIKLYHLLGKVVGWILRGNST